MTRPVVAAHNHADDRVRLHALLTALDASSVALQRDLHRREGRKGDHGIHGKLGHIYADGTGFLLCVNAKDERYQSLRRWTNIKRRLAFCRITQDGDDEGCLRLDQLPTPAEAALIREALGIKRKRHLTPENLATLKNRLSARPTGSPSNDHAIDLIEEAATPHAAPADTARLVHTQQGSGNMSGRRSRDKGNRTERAIAKVLPAEQVGGGTSRAKHRRGGGL
jgi:hypothetical protein